MASSEVAPKKEGYLFKKGALHTQWKKRYFTLVDGELYYRKFPGDTKNKGSIKLQGAEVYMGTTKHLKKRFGFEISSPSQSRVFAIHAESPAAAQEWVAAVEAAIIFLDDKLQEGSRKTRKQTKQKLTGDKKKSKKVGFGKGINISSDTSAFYRSVGMNAGMARWRGSVQRLERCYSF